MFKLPVWTMRNKRTNEYLTSVADIGKILLVYSDQPLVNQLAKESKEPFEFREWSDKNDFCGFLRRCERAGITHVGFVNSLSGSPSEVPFIGDVIAAFESKGVS